MNDTLTAAHFHLQNRTSHGTIGSRRIRAHSSRLWAVLPLLMIVMKLGMPISGNLPVVMEERAAERHERVLEKATKVGIEDTYSVAAYLGTAYILAIVVLVRRRGEALRVLGAQPWLLALEGLFAASILWSDNPTKTFVNTGHLFGGTAVALAAAIAYRNDFHRLMKLLGYALGINIIAQLAAVVVIPGIAVHTAGRWQGLTGNPNTMGLIAFLVIWLNVGSVLLSSVSNRPIHLVLAALGVIGLLGSRSMTAIVCTVAAVVLIVVLCRRHGLGSSISTRFIVFLAIVLPLLLNLALLSNYGTTMRDISDFFGRPASLVGREELWADAVDLIRERPWIGWGFDSKSGILSQTSLPFTNFHNGFLDLTVQGGLVALAFCMLYLRRFMRAVRDCDALQPSIFPIGVSILNATLLYNTTEVSFCAPRNILWILLLLVSFIVQLPGPTCYSHPLPYERR